MNQAQKKHLLERLAIAERDQRYGSSTKPEKDTPEIAKARAAVTRWEKVQRARIDSRQKRVTQTARKVREAIYFADAEVALAAVNKFEGGK